VRDGLAVQDDPRDRHDSGADGDHLGGPVAAVAAPQPDVVAVLQRDDAEAVMLQLVNPAGADRHLQGQDRLASAMMESPTRAGASL